MPPTVVLGNNDGFVSLPKKSYITVGFTDNTIVDGPNQDDLFIEELGGSGEFANVFVSADGKNFVFLGKAQDDGLTSFDLANIGFKEPVVAVKIVGLDNKGASPGFDVRSIKALLGSVGKANKDIPFVAKHAKKREEVVEVKPKPKKEAKREEVVETVIEKKDSVTTLTKPNLEFSNIQFDFDKYLITTDGQTELDRLITTLKSNSELKVSLSGHTDNWGADTYNQTLSQNRVWAVYMYILNNGIEKKRVKIEAFGEKNPLNNNQTPESRALNRRVEIKILN